jgi:hypothetical protein
MDSTLKAPRGTLTLKRKGSFNVKTLGDNHCGVKDLLNIQYDVELLCNAVFDNRGFLVEHLAIDMYFNEIMETALSCELLCVKAAKDIWGVVMQENPTCEILDVKVTLAPEPGHAAMTFNYNTERDALPMGRRPGSVKR